tara:strand:+ start:6745 stop:8046 length:1302 start_codon:yes stop_codon:yes gene_type:complete
MIREQQILRGVLANYTGAPTIKVTVDGATDSVSITAPNQATYKTRFLTASQGNIGYIFKAKSDSGERTDLSIVSDPSSDYATLRYWDYYDITFVGVISVTVYLDDTTTAVISATTLTALNAQDTQRVYFPSNSYGRIPYLVLNTSSTNDGYIVSQKPVAKTAQNLTSSPLMVLRGITLLYKSSPQFTVSLDGSSVQAIAASTVPTQTKYAPRNITLPSGHIGYFPHFESTSTSDIADFNFITEPAASYSDQIVWHFYEVTFSGTVNVSLYVDNVLLVGDGDDASATTTKKTLTTSKMQETIKVYLPALSYGRLPHVLNDKSDAGNVLRWNPVVLPVRFYKTLEGVSECQITYKGNIFVDFYLDGEKLGDTYQFDGQFDATGTSIYAVEKFLLQDNVGGYVFQYIQVAGDGDIISVETDAHPLEVEPVTETEPG